MDRRLDDEVAGVAGHHHSLERTLCAATDLDHLVGSDKMVFQPLAAIGAGGFCPLDDGFKVAVVHITQHLGKVAAGPEFVAGGFVRRMDSKGVSSSLIR